MSLSIGGQSGGTQTRFLELLASLREKRDKQLASGKRIAQAADDSAGLAIAKRLEAEVRGAAQGERNISDGQGLVRVAESALQTSQDTIGRMRELSIQAQNGTLSDADRDVIQQEYDQLSAQLTQTANSTNYGGRTLLDGSVSGDEAVSITDGNGGDTTIEIGDASAGGLGVQGLSVSDPNTLSALDNALESLNSERAGLGALDNTLQRQQEQLAASRINADEARSRIEDLDMARAVSEQTRDRIMGGLALKGMNMSDLNRGRILDLLG